MRRSAIGALFGRGRALRACGRLALAVLLWVGGAGASVSIAVTWDGLLRDSSAAAIVTPVESRSAWENGRIYTYTRARVDRAVAGNVAVGSDVWVRTMGGVVGKIGQLVEGEAVLTPGQSSLLFLHAGPSSVYEVTARGQGQFPIVRDANAAPRLVRSTSTGALLPPSARAGTAVATRPEMPRLAADVVHGRGVEDVARDVADAWSRTAHAP
jgi:hypothetical protein